MFSIINRTRAFPFLKEIAKNIVKNSRERSFSKTDCEHKFHKLLFFKRGDRFVITFDSVCNFKAVVRENFFLDGKLITEYWNRIVFT